MLRFLSAAIVAGCLLSASAFGQTGERESKTPVPASGRPTLKLPSQVTTDIGAPAFVTAETNAARVTWRPRTPGLHMLGPDVIRDPKMLVCWALTPGAYTVEAFVAVGGDVEFSQVTILVGTTPGPPSPLPPYVPPSPVPNPPGPADPLVAELAAMLPTDKIERAAAVAHCQLLAGVYRDGGKIEVLNLFATAGDVTEALQRVRRAKGIPDEAIMPIRTRLGADYLVLFPAKTTLLTDVSRGQASALFTRFAVVLSQVR